MTSDNTALQQQRQHPRKNSQRKTVKIPDNWRKQRNLNQITTPEKKINCKRQSDFYHRKKKESELRIIR